MNRSDSIRLASGLRLNADFVGGASLALLGQRGSGKTFSCQVLAEELTDAHFQTVIIDPMGVFWGFGPVPCSLKQQNPYDFAWCETHDRTFALGEDCPSRATPEGRGGR